MTVEPELAQADGINPLAVRLMFSLLLAVVVALSMQVVGILLITALLIIPAAAARRFSATPEQMALLRGARRFRLRCALGLWGSFVFDAASGPSIVVAALLLFPHRKQFGGPSQVPPGIDQYRPMNA